MARMFLFTVLTNVIFSTAFSATLKTTVTCPSTVEVTSASTDGFTNVTNLRLSFSKASVGSGSANWSLHCYYNDAILLYKTFSVDTYNCSASGSNGMTCVPKVAK